MVGIVVTTSPSLSLYSTVVLPDMFTFIIKYYTIILTLTGVIQSQHDDPAG